MDQSQILEDEREQSLEMIADTNLDPGSEAIWFHVLSACCIS